MAEVDTFIEDFGNGIKKQDELTQPMSTPKKILQFTEETSIIGEPSVSKRKPIGLTQPYFRPRSNLEPTSEKETVSHYGV